MYVIRQNGKEGLYVDANNKFVSNISDAKLFNNKFSAKKYIVTNSICDVYIVDRFKNSTNITIEFYNDWYSIIDGNFTVLKFIRDKMFEKLSVFVFGSIIGNFNNQIESCGLRCYDNSDHSKIGKVFIPIVYEFITENRNKFNNNVYLLFSFIMEDYINKDNIDYNDFDEKYLNFVCDPIYILDNIIHQLMDNDELNNKFNDKITNFINTL